jgi:hypothetical protein
LQLVAEKYVPIKNGFEHGVSLKVKLEAGMKNTAEIRKAESRNRIARIYPQMTQIDAEIGRGGDRVHDLVGWKRKKITPPRKSRKSTGKREKTKNQKLGKPGDKR